MTTRPDPVVHPGQEQPHELALGGLVVGQGEQLLELVDDDHDSTDPGTW